MPCPFTGPKMFSATSKTFVPAQKPILLNANNQVYKKVVKFSFTKQKIFWVLVFSFMYLVSVDPMDRSLI